MSPVDPVTGGGPIPPTEPTLAERLARAWNAIVQVFIPTYKDPTDPGSGAPRG